RDAVRGRGPARPTPSRALVAAQRLRRPSGSAGFSTPMARRADSAVGSSRSMTSPFSVEVVWRDAAPGRGSGAGGRPRRAGTLATISWIRWVSFTISPSAAQEERCVAGLVRQAAVGPQPDLFEPALELGEGTHLQRLSQGSDVVVGGGLVAEHGVVTHWDTHD